MRLAVLLTLLVASPVLAQHVVIDPGHGGSDPGAVGCGLQEATVVLDIATRTATLLRSSGFTVDLTRSDNRSVSLSARTSYANSRGADRFVSIHANSNAGTPATGSETFAYTSASSTSLNLRDRIQEEMIRAWALRNRGGKTANFHVLRETSMPSALSETGFINNCGTDARYLGDATRRAQMAEAHYRALMRHYGRTPGSTTPPPTTGTLQGVVFEDVGRGLEDTSMRVAGAAVRLDGRSERATSAASTGAWSFAVPAGSYTVVASLDGFEEGRRTCDVAAGGETWCSVGIRRSTPPPPPPPPPPADAGTPEVDAGSEELEDAGTAPVIGTDAGTEIPELEPDAGADFERMATAGGCSASGASEGAPFGLLLALIVLVSIRRRATRRVLARVALSSVALVVGCHDAGVDSRGATLLDERELPMRIETAREIAPFASLEAVETRHEEHRFVSVELAPVGPHLALAPEGFGALIVSDGVTLRTLAQGPARGFAPTWRSDGLAIGARTPGQSESAVPHLAFALDGSEVAPVTAADHALVWVDAHDQVIVDVNGHRRTVVLPGDRPFAPRLSPDRRHVVFRGLSTGLYVHELATGRTLHLGEGGNPRFDASSRFVVFERVLDDGHEITSADLWIADLQAGELAPLRATDALETSPSIGEGARVAWLADGVIHVGQLRSSRF